MTKITTNWRKVATIIACLTVTIMFAACDSSNPNDDDDGNGDGSIDSKLVGKYWYYSDVAQQRYYHYYFRKDGTVSFYEIQGAWHILESKFTTSKGKIYLTESYRVYAEGDNRKRDDKIVEYAVGSDDTGAYLHIANIMGEAASSELPESPRKFRQSSGTFPPKE